VESLEFFEVNAWQFSVENPWENPWKTHGKPMGNPLEFEHW